ncbi:MAG: type I methionyl aminopeptidase [Spirochaetia bacterium]
MIRIKTPSEIVGIRKSCHLLAKIFDEIIEFVEPGKTPIAINAFAEKLIAKALAKPAFSTYAKFPTAMCISVNDAVIHGVPDNRPIKEGDILSMDLGLEKDGFFSDMAQTLAIGKISEEATRLLVDTNKSLYLGIDAIKAGARIRDIGKAISCYLKPLGYGVVYEFCGHGVGLAVHEDPQISHDYPSSGGNQRIRAGMTLAIEPMVNLGKPEVKIDKKDGWTVKTIDGKISAHFEHTIAVFEDHIEILTKPSF